MAKILFPTTGGTPQPFGPPPQLLTAEQRWLFEQNNSNAVFVGARDARQFVLADDVSLVQRIMTRLDRALTLILETNDDIQGRQQNLLSLLMDVLQQQPDPLLVNLIIVALRKHGIMAYHYFETDETPCLLSNPNRFLVRLGPIVLELWNDEGYSELLRGARDLCQLKNTNTSST